MSRLLGSLRRRYLSEGVGGYAAGGRSGDLLMEHYYSTASSRGDVTTAALQAAIWELLTDTQPSLAQGQGSYFVRNDTSDAYPNQRSNEIVAWTELWFAEAGAADWGGADYDPADKVIFWLDPDSTQANQSVITLNPDFNAFRAVPEPGVALFVLVALTVAALRRRMNRVGT